MIFTRNGIRYCVGHCWLYREESGVWLPIDIIAPSFTGRELFEALP
jgi:hypothetical protein